MSHPPSSLFALLDAWTTQPRHWAVLAGDRGTAKTSVLFALAAMALDRDRAFVFWEWPPRSDPVPWSAVPDRAARLWLLDEWDLGRMPLPPDVSRGAMALEMSADCARELVRCAPFPPDTQLAWVVLSAPTSRWPVVHWRYDDAAGLSATGDFPRGPWARALPRELHASDAARWSVYAWPAVAGAFAARSDAKEA
jgi:hypothetical protein